MKTPLVDFLRKYSASDTVRAHMPGHKGRGSLGSESLDITEVRGADSLYSADGVIRESELLASQIFGADTFYSAEGSSLSIKAMVYLAALYAREMGRRPVIAAGRNAHKSFINAAALLGVEVVWLAGKESYLSYKLDKESLSALLSGENAPAAVYLTSPDYLGNTADIESVSKMCKTHGVLLLVDNAHGAYLKFLEPSRHPIDLGADMCSDSAHKTLSALTGAAYLHISKKAPPVLSKMAKYAMSIFGSTSPSYPIMASLDLLNESLSGEYRKALKEFVERITICKEKLTNNGYLLIGDEPLKISLLTKPYGYSGDELADLLRTRGIEPEFSDPDALVLMLTPQNTVGDVNRIEDALLSVSRKKPISDPAPVPFVAERVLSPGEALMTLGEEISVTEAEGRVLASAGFSCPPAVPILIMGERIDGRAIRAFRYYGIERVRVVKKL